MYISCVFWNFWIKYLLRIKTTKKNIVIISICFFQNAHIQDTSIWSRKNLIIKSFQFQPSHILTFSFHQYPSYDKEKGSRMVIVPYSTTYICLWEFWCEKKENKRKRCTRQRYSSFFIREKYFLPEWKVVCHFYCLLIFLLLFFLFFSCRYKM